MDSAIVLNGNDLNKQLREKIRIYSRDQRNALRRDEMDSLRFGLGEIQAKIEKLDNITETDVMGMVGRIKRSKRADLEDLYRLCHAFLQSMTNIQTFVKITGSIQTLVRELTGNDFEHQIIASECLCNLSLGESVVCDKIACLAGSYLVTYLDGEEHLKRTSLWTLANLLATGGKAARTIMQMELVPKLWALYIGGDHLTDAATTVDDYRTDAAICLQLIAIQSKSLLSERDFEYINTKLDMKNPTFEGSEYHLQIIFHCNIINTQNLLNKQHLVYLINYSLSNLTQALECSKESAAHRLRLLYAVRIIGNLIATQPKATALLLDKVANVWKMNLAQIFNKLFHLQSEMLTIETLWLLKTFLQQNDANVGDGSAADSFLDKLQIVGSESIKMLLEHCVY